MLSLKVSLFLMVFFARVSDFLFFAVARHLYGYIKVLDGDADPTRPDNYGVENV